MVESVALQTLPVLLVGSLLVVAIVLYLLRSWERFTAAVATLFVGGWAWWLWQLDLSTPMWTVPLWGQTIDVTAPLAHLGFTFALQPSALAMLITMFLLAAAAFALTLLTNQGHSFVPFSLVLLAGYSALMLMTAGPLSPPLLMPLAFVLLTTVAVFVLQAGRLTTPSGPLRLLIPPVLAFPFFLAAQWYVDLFPLNPQDTGPQSTVALLLTIGMLLLMAPAPLHSAQPAIAQSAPPLVTALVTLLYQLALLFLLFQLLTLFPFMASDPTFEQWFLWAGLATTIWGGIAAAGALQPGRLWGYAALHDWGLILILLAVPTPTSWPLALFLFGLRAVSMLTAAAGLSVLEHHIPHFSLERLRGAGNRIPWNSAAFLLGGLGLTGFPLSAGFTGHWTALQIMAESDWRPAAIVMLSSVGAIWGFVRIARILFGPLHDRMLVREQPASIAVALIVLLVTVSLAVSPQLLDAPIRSAWTAFGG